MEGSSGDGIPDNVREMIRQIKNVTATHSDDEIYQMLLECNMDVDETTERLCYFDTFEEVASKRDRRKGRDGGSRSTGQPAMGERGIGVTGGRSTRPRKEIRLGDYMNKGPEISPTVPVHILQNSSRSKRKSHKKASVGGSRNASNGQAVHEQGAQNSAEVASNNSTEMIREVTPEFVNEQTVSALDLQMSEIDFSALHPVMFPNRLRLLDAFKGGLSFGSMDIEYEKRFARELETRVVHKTTPDNEDIAKETFVSDQGASLTPQEGDHLVHPESPRHVPEVSSLQEGDNLVHPVPEISHLQEGVSVNEAMENDQQIPIHPTLDGEPQQSEGPEIQVAANVPQSSLDVFQPPPNYEHGTAYGTNYSHTGHQHYVPSSLSQYEGATTGNNETQQGVVYTAPPQGFHGYYNYNYGQQLYPSAQAGHSQHVYSAMQQASPFAGHHAYYHAMQHAAIPADPNAYYNPAMQYAPSQADPNVYYQPAMQYAPTQAYLNAYYHSALLQAPTQAYPNASYHVAVQQAPTQADPNASYHAAAPTQADPNASYHAAMQQTPTQADPNASNDPSMQQAPTQANPSAYNRPAMQQASTQADPSAYNRPAMQQSPRFHQFEMQPAPRFRQPAMRNPRVHRSPHRSFRWQRIQQ